MHDIENKLREQGYKNIACIDEVGRGCLLGDVVACAVIMPEDKNIEGIKDSKKLSAIKREAFFHVLVEEAIAYGIGRVSSQIIDEINIKQSTRLAMKMAVENLKDKSGNKIIPDYILIDAENIDMDIPQEAIIKGDDKVYGISCASIIAKVYRDRLCLDWAKEYPDFHIEAHKGYGTKKHIEAIEAYGITPIHRSTFLKKYMKVITNE